MKNKKHLIIIVSLLIMLLVGCSKTNNNTPTMTCTTKKTKKDGIERQTVVVYKINKEQLIYEYISSTTQKFDSKKMYNEYKKSQQKSVKESSTKDAILSLKINDKKKELVFTLTLKNLTKNIKTEEEKNAIKASKVLKSNEESQATCKFNGIKKEDLK